MSDRLRIVLLILLVLWALVLIGQGKKKKVDIRYILSWLLLVIVLAILAIFPDFLSYVSALCGVALPINLLFLLGFIFTLVIIYSLTISVSKLNNEVKELSQRLAMAEKEARDIERRGIT